MAYESLTREAYQNNIDIYEKPLKPRVKGLYSDNIIWINKHIETKAEKICVLAEELGHYHTSFGNILDQSKINNRKQEKMARRWPWNKLITPKKLILAFKDGCRSKHEIAEYLNITEPFLEEGIIFYREKYGTQMQVDNNYILYLDPLAVYEIIE